MMTIDKYHKIMYSIEEAQGQFEVLNDFHNQKMDDFFLFMNVFNYEFVESLLDGKIDE